MLQMDITALGFKDDSFDFVMCNHVLEHVPNDRAAISEFYRVMRPGSSAILTVPVAGETTVGDLSITDRRERERLYGNADHVRLYGLDYSIILEKCGFKVIVATVPDFFTSQEKLRFGLSEASGFIHLVTKTGA